MGYRDCPAASAARPAALIVPPPLPSAQQAALRAEQVRQYIRAVPLSMVLLGLLALLLVAIVRDRVPTPLLALWLAGVVATGAARVVLAMSARRATSPGTPFDHDHWLLRFRVVMLLLGCSWALAGVFPFHVTDGWKLDLLMFALLGLSAGALLVTAFDWVGALAYAAPMLLPVAWYTATHPLGQLPPSLPIVSLLLPVAVATMVRNHRALRQSVAVTQDQARREDELRRAAELVDRTGAVAGVGGWDVDAATRALQLSPHALRLLDMAPDARPRIDDVTCLLAPDDARRLLDAMDATLDRGEALTLELGLRTAAGRQVIVRIVGQPRRQGGRVVGIDGAVQDVTRLHTIDRALADKHQLLEQLQRTARQGFWFIDTEGRTTDLNPSMTTLLGRSRDEVLGLPALDFFDGEDRQRVAAAQAARRDGRDGSYEVNVRRPDGSTRRCLVHGSPLFDARGQRVGAVGIWTDITRRHEAEEALRVSEVVINGSAEIISVVDGQMTYHMVNDAWCKATGVARDRALGRRAPVVLPGVITPAWNEALQRCLDSQQPDELAVVLKLGDAPERHLLTSFYPVTTGSQRLAALVTRDVTQDVVQRSALITSAEYLRGTLDATGDAIFATDADALDEPARFANDQLLRLWGLPLALRAALTSRHVLERIRSLVDEPDRVERQMDDIVAAGVPAEYRLTLRDGRIVQMRFACMTLAGRKLRVWSGRDVTTESRAVMAREATLAEQRALLEKFPGYIAVIDGDNRYLHVNDRLARLFRRPAADVVGRTGAEVLGEQRWRKVRQALDQTRRVGTAISDSQYASEDGQSQLDLEVTHIAGPRHADGSQLVYSFGIDVTERKRAQAALIDALAEAERANKAKSQFLSNMSHELRTPLNAVLGFGQLLANRPLDDEQRHQVAEILRGGRHLLGLINDLLDLGRIEAGELEVVCEGVDAHDAIAQSLGLMQPLALERDVVLRHRDGDSPPALAWADPKRLRQVLLNLVSNAIKYNQPGGVVVVESEAIGDVVEFRVRDSGPGLSAEQQQRLFRPFERLDAGRGNVDGTGIGLALSRYLVDAMGGRIGVHSEPGRGSTFWFRLRLSGQPAPVALPGEQPPPAVRRHTALYIEDNPVNLMLMSAMLEDELDLVAEADPFKGLDKAFTLRPELILLDIQLPGIDGYEVLRRLRADPRTARTPVVAVSANAMRADLAAGRAAGFDAYLTKPVDLDELLSTLRRLLQPDTAG
jgi:PAS domain S-box-containing protein